MYRAKPSDSTDFVPDLTPQMAQAHCKRTMIELNLTPKNVGRTELNPVTQLIVRRILHHKWLSRIVSDPMTEFESYTKNVGCTEQTQWLTDFVRILTPQMAQPHCKRTMIELNVTTIMLGVQSKTQWLNWFCAESYTTNGSAA